MHDHISVCPGEATENRSTGGHAELSYNAHWLSELTIVCSITSCSVFFIVYLSLVLSFALLPLIFTTLFVLILRNLRFWSHHNLILSLFFYLCNLLIKGSSEGLIEAHSDLNIWIFSAISWVRCIFLDGCKCLGRLLALGHIDEVDLLCEGRRKRALEESRAVLSPVDYLSLSALRKVWDIVPGPFQIFSFFLYLRFGALECRAIHMRLVADNHIA